MRLFDENGRSYLDFISGIGVAALGHAHPGLARALADQATSLLHTSNLYFHPLQGELAERLADLTGLDRAFFCNSGTEAVEACLKFARRYWHTQGVADRTEFVAFTHSFHGRTMGSLSVTWDDHYRAPFEPLVPGVAFADPADPASVVRLVSDRTAAVIVEPIQGEGGVRPLPAAVVEAIAAACRRTGALLIADEVQSGSGRTGAVPLQPDGGPHAGPRRARQGARRGRADWRRACSATRLRRRCRPAITARRTAAICSRAGRRSFFLDALEAAGSRLRCAKSAAICSGSFARWPPRIRTRSATSAAGGCSPGSS